MPWDDVWNKIEQEFSSKIILGMHLEKRERAVNWLRRLKDSPEGVQLVSCILIDTRNRVRPELFSRILELLGDAGPPVRAFARALDQYESLEPDTFWQQRLLPFNGDGSFARVIEIRPFIQYCLRTEVRFAEESDIEDVRASLKEGRTIGPLKRLTGGRKRVWVLPPDELDALTTGLDADHAGEPVVDALGLNMPKGGGPSDVPELLSIRYPEEHGVPSAQPATMDANWNAANYFLSYQGGDGWGRTHSCSGAAKSVRERIHRDLTSGLDQGYQIQYIGLAPIRKEDRIKLIEEALKRLGFWEEDDDGSNQSEGSDRR